MYTILVTDSNELIVTERERIMQRSSLVDSLHFLVSPTYKDEIDMSDFTVTLEYTLPVSKEYRSETLVLSDELYKDYLEYKLPFSTQLTSEAGNISVQLTFIKVDLDEEGVGIEQVRKTSPVSITIVPIAAWSDLVPDSALTAVDQRIVKLQALIAALEELQQQILKGKADDLSYEDHILQLLSEGEKIGNPVTIEEGEPCTCDNGLKVTII